MSERSGTKSRKLRKSRFLSLPSPLLLLLLRGGMHLLTSTWNLEGSRGAGWRVSHLYPTLIVPPCRTTIHFIVGISSRAHVGDDGEASDPSRTRSSRSNRRLWRAHGIAWATWRAQHRLWRRGVACHDMRRTHLERRRARRELKEHRSRERVARFTRGLDSTTRRATPPRTGKVPSAVVGRCARAVFLRAPQPSVITPYL